MGIFSFTLAAMCMASGAAYEAEAITVQGHPHLVENDERGLRRRSSSWPTKYIVIGITSATVVLLGGGGFLVYWYAITLPQVTPPTAMTLLLIHQGFIHQELAIMRM